MNRFSVCVCVCVHMCICMINMQVSIVVRYDYMNAANKGINYHCCSNCIHSIVE